MTESAAPALVRLRRIAAGVPTADDDAWLRARARALLTGQAKDPNQAFGIGDVIEADRRRRRDAAIMAYVADFCGESSANARAARFARDMSDFESRVWPLHRDKESAPGHLTPRHVALFAIMKIGAPTISARTLRRMIVGHGGSSDGQR